MSKSRPFKRLIWPSVSVAVSIALYMFHQPVLDALRFPVETGALRVLTGGASYFSAAWLGGRLAGFILERAGAGAKRRPVPKLLLELVSAALFLAAGIATIMLVAGQSLSGALAGSGLVIAVLGFAIRNVLADVFSGIAVGIEAPYRIGDWVAIDDKVRGRIIEIGWRSTRLLTRDDTYMILPNSQIARQKLTNYSAPRRHYRAKVPVLLNHEIPVRDAKALLTAAAAKSATIVSLPAPDVKVVSYDAEGIRYHVRFWVPSFTDDVDCRDGVLSEIDAALRERALPPPVLPGQVTNAAKPLNGQAVGASG